MKGMWLRRRYAAGVVGAAVLVAFAASGSFAGPGKKNQGYLGVYMQQITSDLREGLDLKKSDKGVLISGVEDDSPADKAGLEDGDVIVEFDGKSVTSPDELRDLVGDTGPGSKVEVVVIRDGDRKTFDIVVAERPEDFGTFLFNNEEGEPYHWNVFRGDHPGIASLFTGARLGVEATELNEGLAPYFKTKPGEGVLVLDVQDESVASRAGVKAGDVIQKVDDDSIESVGDLRESVRDFDEGDEFQLTVLRDGRTEKLKATMDEPKMAFFWSGDMPHAKHLDRDAIRRNIREYRVQTDKDVDKALDELRSEIKDLKKEIRELKKKR
jgi:S1-C subfamily serine protease